MCHKILNPISHTVMQVIIFWQMIDNSCFFWSAVWVSSDSSLRSSYGCNTNPLAYGQTIMKVKMKHDLIATGSLLLCLGFSLLPLNYICIHKWYLRRRPTFLQLAVTLFAMCWQHHFLPSTVTGRLHHLLQFRRCPLHCLWQKKAYKPVPCIFLLWFMVMYRTNK